MNKSSPNSCDEVVSVERFCTPHAFDFSSKHPQGVHIECYVEKTTMQKHVGAELPDEEF